MPIDQFYDTRGREGRQHAAPVFSAPPFAGKPGGRVPIPKLAAGQRTASPLVKPEMPLICRQAASIVYGSRIRCSAGGMSE